MTPCECEQPGYCHRHQCEKTRHWHRLCRTRPGYFQLWEEGRGPGQQIRVNPVEEIPCRHQGVYVREQECDTCGGRVRLKVFLCGIYGECTLRKHLSGIACCRTCDDYDQQVSGDRTETTGVERTS